MPRDGTKNLKPMNQRSKDEARRLGSKGGKASGIARRKKAELKKALNVVLTSQVHQPKLAALLEEMGFENSYETAIVFSMANKATQGDVRAAEWISKLMDNEKDDLDRKEQRERIKSLKLDNKERAEANKITDAPIQIVDEWAGELEGVTDDL
ncbi:stress-induced protein [Streptococcus sp. HMSC034F03]|uniref:KGG domain-containing protein n=1 Tax=Streptococcus sp. HMSC034F03 TaxID=1739287 RepID=UPI0008A9ED75|nr:KGG domain-containing protein [Streptococcus sp. HMSC034F03]OHR60943.1 stress-induced protein [Streptococcus sp. HMSC034F03]